MKVEWNGDQVQTVLERIEHGEPFVRDPTGLDAIRRGFLAVQELFLRLHAAEPAAFWLTLIGLGAIVFALSAHIGWSLWVLYRAFRDPAVASAPVESSRDVKGEARAAIQAGEPRRALELLWHGLCLRFGGTLSDTPRRQLQRLQLDQDGMTQAMRILQLREKASFSTSAVGVDEAREALKVFAELELTQ
ncbi:MAG: hypothetical protein AAFU77_12210 [Myxococcota bacterium]